MSRITLLFLFVLACQTAVYAASPKATGEAPQPAPYLRPSAPTFDLTLVNFRAHYNQAFPSLPLEEYRAISVRDENLPLTRAATRINAAVYSSVVLEKGTGKIKSLQITYLPCGDGERGKEKRGARNGAETPDRQLAIRYMAALMQSFSPTISPQQSLEKVAELLSRGRSQPYYSQQDGSLRYVVSDSGEKGITFAVEPIKLSLSEDAGS
ncbi:YiiQ family protein [Edwardsiella ictaluri]|uniref:DUF1454 family protein n=1 Tax=Edwardsiella ictaluri TaxID=67780 RepID=UPI0009C017A4|nr:DUF1454 family protein [Edwardsiella ictaluri]ARD39750.1 hypothetical protein B6E78_10510 [Edwardsiella ictaluri]QPW28199.1 YiiQ family protein [Edwardsiella ictaluri]